LLGQVAAQQVATFAAIGVAKLGAVHSKTEANFGFGFFAFGFARIG
jgi:hypothetical protein